jgi:hypothetical protein
MDEFDPISLSRPPGTAAATTPPTIRTPRPGHLSNRVCQAAPWIHPPRNEWGKKTRTRLESNQDHKWIKSRWEWMSGEQEGFTPSNQRREHAVACSGNGSGRRRCCCYSGLWCATRSLCAPPHELWPPWPSIARPPASPSPTCLTQRAPATMAAWLRAPLPAMA